MNGGTSCTTLEQPPIIDILPMRQNWWIADQPANDRVILHR